MTFADFARALRANWVVVIAALLLGAGVGAGVSALQTPKYQSSAAVLIAAQAPADVADANQGSTYAQQVVKSFAYIATSEIVLNRVVDRLGLKESADSLSSQVSASVPLDTQVVALTASASSPTDAARIVNALATSLAGSVDLITPSLSTADNVITVTTIQRGTPAANPVSPNTRLSIALGALIGLVLGVIAAVLRERRADEREEEAAALRADTGSIRRPAHTDGPMERVATEPVVLSAGRG